MIGDRYKQLALSANKSPSQTHPYKSDKDLQKVLKMSTTPTLYINLENYSPIPYSLPSPVKLTAIRRPLTVTYKPRYDGKWADVPFVVYGATITRAIRVRDFSHFLSLRGSPPINFILDFTLISNNLFSVAKDNPFLPIYIQIDYFSYSCLLKEGIIKRGLDPSTESVLALRSDCEAAEVIYNNAIALRKEGREAVEV